MEYVIIAFVIIVIMMLIAIGVMGYIIKNKGQSKEEQEEENLPYLVNEKLLTDKELKFYRSLKPITDRRNLEIMCKVRLADIVRIPEGNKSYIKWFNYIKAKHIDFVVCSSDTSPLYVIEVDDKTHEREDRKKRDEFINKIFENSKIKLFRYKTWTNEQLETDFSEKIEKSPKTAE